MNLCQLFPGFLVQHQPLASQFSQQLALQKTLQKLCPTKKRTSPISSCQNLRSPNAAFRCKKCKRECLNLTYRKGGGGEGGRLWPHFLSKSVFIPQTESPNGQGDSPGPQALAEGDYRETFTLMNTDVNHLLKVTPRQRLCLLPKGPRWDIWHAALFLVFGQEQIWGQLINLSASD